MCLISKHDKHDKFQTLWVKDINDSSIGRVDAPRNKTLTNFEAMQVHNLGKYKFYVVKTTGGEDWARGEGRGECRN